MDNAITMGLSAMASLKRLIPNTQQFGTAVEESENPDGVFYNPSGPISPNQGDIYIDCQPTGDDGEVLVPTRQETTGLLNNSILREGNLSMEGKDYQDWQNDQYAWDWAATKLNLEILLEVIK